MNRFILTICTVVLCWSPHLSAQKYSVDSLKNVLNGVYGSEKIIVQLKLSEELTYSNPSEALKYGEKALLLSKKLENDSLTAVALSHISTLYDKLDKDAKAVTYYLDVLRIYVDKDMPEKQAVTLFNLGTLYYYQNNYAKALDYFYKALEIFGQIDAGDRASTTIFRIGMVFQKREEPGKALEYYFKALEKSKNIRNYSMSAQISVTIADVYLSLGDKKNAIDFLNKALRFSEKLPGKPGKHAIAMILMEISSIYNSKNSYKEAMNFNKKALKVAKAMDNKLLMALSYENRARIYADKKEYTTSNFYLNKSIGLLEEAGYKTQVVHNRLFLAKNYFALGNYEKAVSEAVTVQHYAVKAGKPGMNKSALQQLSASESAQNNYSTAFKWQQKLIALNDSLYAEEKTKQIAKMRARYETERKEQEIALLEKRQEKANLLRNALLVGLLLLAIIAFLIFNRQRLKIVKNKTSMENTRLKQQQLKQDLKFKNKQLTTHSLNLVQKNEVMKELKQRIIKLQDNSAGKPDKELKNITRLVDYSFNLDKDWKEFRLYFEEVHVGFFDLLKKDYPDLTSSELRLSALVKLNLTIKEISTILNISPDSVKTARYRLRKKFGLQTEDNLSDFLYEIDHKAMR